MGAYIRSHRSELLILLGCAILVMVQYAYFDCVDAVKNSVNLWHALFDGQPFNFYQYTRMPEHLQTFNSFSGLHGGASYNYFAYLVFAIWNLPLYLLERFASVPLFQTAWPVMYAKLGLLLVSCANAFELRSIAKEAGVSEKKADWLPLAYLSSSLFFSCTMAVGQLEVFTIFFMLHGFKAYVKHDWRYCLWFSLAVPFKYFALFTFIPLLLLEEKKIGKLAAKLMLVLLPTLALKLLFWTDEHALVGVLSNYQGTVSSIGTAVLSQGINQAGTSIQLGGFTIHLFALVYLVLCVICYQHKANNPLHRAAKGGYFCMCGNLAFLLCFRPMHPYWAVLLMPFLLLTCTLCSRDLKKSLWLETAASTFLVLWQLLAYDWVFGYYAMKNNPFLLGSLQTASDKMSVRSVLNKLESLSGIPMAEYAMQVLAAGIVIAFAMFLWQHRPTEAALNGNALLEAPAVRTWVGIRVLCAALPLLMSAGAVYFGLWLS